MALKYVVTKRVFGFDKTNTEKYVAKSVGSGKMNFDKMCEKVSRLCGIHRKVVDLVVSGLVDMMAEDIDDGKTIQMGEFGLFRPTIKTKSADTEDAVKASNILSKRIVFTPGKIYPFKTYRVYTGKDISFQNVSCLHRERYSTAC